MSDTQNPTTPAPSQGAGPITPPQPGGAVQSTSVASTAGAEKKTITNASSQTQAAGAVGGNGAGVTFKSSEIGNRENARTKDYFAEQNRKNSAKKQRRSVKSKWILISCCGVLGVVLVVGLVWAIIAMVTRANDPYAGMTETERTEYNQKIAQDVYEAATDGSRTDDGEVSSTVATDVFQQAIDAAQNTTEADVIRVSQMRYLLENGDYARILEIGRTPCENTNLDLVTRNSCANIMELAASYTGDQELADYYNDLMIQLIDELIRMEYPEGGQDENE